MRQENLVAGDLPDPNSDSYDWIFQGYWNVEVSSLTDASQPFKAEFDLKAMRKVRINEDIIYIIEVDTGAEVGIEFDTAWRLLFQK